MRDGRSQRRPSNRCDDPGREVPERRAHRRGEGCRRRRGSAGGAGTTHSGRETRRACGGTRGLGSHPRREHNVITSRPAWARSRKAGPRRPPRVRHGAPSRSSRSAILCVVLAGTALAVDTRAAAAFDSPKRLVAVLGTALAAACLLVAGRRRPPPRRSLREAPLLAAPLSCSRRPPSASPLSRPWPRLAGRSRSIRCGRSAFSRCFCRSAPRALFPKARAALAAVFLGGRRPQRGRRGARGARALQPVPARDLRRPPGDGRASPATWVTSRSLSRSRPSSLSESW